MHTLIAKLSSRKFLSTIAGVVMGLAMVFGLDEGTISTVAGAVVSLASIVAYIHTEGKIDAAAVSQTIEFIEDIAAEFTEDGDAPKA